MDKWDAQHYTLPSSKILLNDTLLRFALPPPPPSPPPPPWQTNAVTSPHCEEWRAPNSGLLVSEVLLQQDVFAIYSLQTKEGQVSFSVCLFVFLVLFYHFVFVFLFLCFAFHLIETDRSGRFLLEDRLWYGLGDLCSNLVKTFTSDHIAGLMVKWYHFQFLRQNENKTKSVQMDITTGCWALPYPPR